MYKAEAHNKDLFSEEVIRGTTNFLIIWACHSFLMNE